MNNLEYTLAKRTAQHDGSSRAAVMMRIATISVALALAVMIITLAVFNGFRYEIYADLRGFGADIQLMEVSGLRRDAQPFEQEQLLVERVAEIDGVRSIAPYLVIGGMAKCGDETLGLQLKGIDGSYDTAWWQSRIVEGELPAVNGEERTKQLLLSRTTAERLAIGVGDKVEILYVSAYAGARRDSYKVSGLYHTGLEEMDLMLAIADLRDVRRTAALEGEMISGYDIMLDNAKRSDEVSDAIDELLFMDEDIQTESCIPATLELRHPIIFDWFKAHTVIAEVVIIIMMAVLLFNMAAAMLIMVFDRIGMIGALKAQGMRSSAIRRIFLYRAAILFFKGALWGNAVGGAAVMVQALWQPIKLDPYGYMLSVLPISFSPMWWVVLNVATLIVTVAVMVLPSAMVARIRPEESLKYKL
jgi:lipoprotein-releasing system permease protein